MQMIIDALLSAHAWISNVTMETIGVPLPFAVTLSLPFLAPLIWAATLRSSLAFVASAALAWLGSTFLSSEGFTVTALAGFAVAFAVAITLCAQAIATRNRIARLEHTLDETEGALMAAFHDLDRERLWRRAGGDARTTLNDEEIASLIQRFEEFRRTRDKEATASDAKKATEAA